MIAKFLILDQNQASNMTKLLLGQAQFSGMDPWEFSKSMSSEKEVKKY